MQRKFDMLCPVTVVAELALDGTADGFAGSGSLDIDKSSCGACTDLVLLVGERK
jgi:hypothetical protein